MGGMSSVCCALLQCLITPIMAISSIQRAIILRLDAGDSPTEIGQSLGVSRKTIYKRRTRFLEERVEGLHDALRPGRPTVIDEETVQAVLK